MGIADDGDGEQGDQRIHRDADGQRVALRARKSAVWRPISLPWRIRRKASVSPGGTGKAAPPRRAQPGPLPPTAPHAGRSPCTRTIKRPPSGNCAASNPRGGNDQPANKAQVRPGAAYQWAFCRRRSGRRARVCQTFLVQQKHAPYHPDPRRRRRGTKKWRRVVFAPPSLGRKRPRMQRAEAPLGDPSRATPGTSASKAKLLHRRRPRVVLREVSEIRSGPDEFCATNVSPCMTRGQSAPAMRRPGRPASPSAVCYKIAILFAVHATTTPTLASPAFARHWAAISRSGTLIAHAWRLVRRSRRGTMPSSRTRETRKPSPSDRGAGAGRRRCSFAPSSPTRSCGGSCRRAPTARRGRARAPLRRVAHAGARGAAGAVGQRADRAEPRRGAVVARPEPHAGRGHVRRDGRDGSTVRRPRGGEDAPVRAARARNPARSGCASRSRGRPAALPRAERAVPSGDLPGQPQRVSGGGIADTRQRLAPFRRAQFRTMGRLALSYQEHARVVRAIERGDRAQAQLAMREHIGIVHFAYEQYTLDRAPPRPRWERSRRARTTGG